ncbi:MAG: TraR/DksA C4-type zinc finger protein [Pseudomonadota bacterium]|nr:TraR/DksA C4-type zinc finger protein [Pseudomonadota bacterium]
MAKLKNAKDVLKTYQDSEYMNQEQQDFFKLKLEQDKVDLIDRIQSVRTEITNLQSNQSDDNDNATMDELVNRNLSLVQRQTKLLHKIEQALDRLATGEYGYCEKTGEPIGIPRLLARPTSSLSIEAKEHQEILEKRDEQ